jgi:hypothetical protein
MSQKVQSFENHAKMVPMFHGVLFVTLLLVLGAAVYGVFIDFSVLAIAGVVLVIALFMTTAWTRIFALGVQDRLIRLEEQLRMERVLPEELHARIPEIGTKLRIGLRFAPDDELSGLVRRVLDGELDDQKSVKQAIKNWKSDHERI